MDDVRSHRGVVVYAVAVLLSRFILIAAAGVFAQYAGRLPSEGC